MLDIKQKEVKFAKNPDMSPHHADSEVGSEFCVGVEVGAAAEEM